MLSLNCKHVHHVEIYIPCNFEVNLITHLVVLALFHQFCKKKIILFVLYFKNYKRLSLNCKNVQHVKIYKNFPTVKNVRQLCEELFLLKCIFSYCHYFSSSSVVHPSTFHIFIFSSETTGPIAAKLWWNGPWMAPFQNCVR